MEKEIKSFVDVNLIDRFPSRYPNKSFLNYVSNQVGLEGVLAVAGFLAPDLIEKEGGIFLSENFPMLNAGIRTRFGNEVKALERYVNLLCLSDFYLMAADEASQDESLLLELGRIITRFWEMYLTATFPEKRFDIELSNQGLFDEDGICITFSQAN